MLTIDQIVSYLTSTIAEDRLRGDREALRQTQLACGVLMRAAEAAGDRETAVRFRGLASQAANKQEELEGDE
jgi:hypothetical protein